MIVKNRDETVISEFAEALKRRAVNFREHTGEERGNKGIGVDMKKL